MKKICIIGGGVSGLTAAYEQKKAGHTVKLLESGSNVGGVIQSKNSNGFLLDYGANTLNIRLKTTKSFLIDCHAWDDCIDANQEASKRMIIRDGRIIDLPHSFASFLTSPFLSLRGKLRLLCEPFISRGKHTENESVDSFISRRLGKEALDYAGNPFLAGIFAAKPESLNLKQAFPKMWEIEDKYRSLFLGFRKKNKEADNPNLKKPRLVSFAQGMKELPQKIGSILKEEIFCNQTVKTVCRNSNTWDITVQTKSGEIYKETFDQVISTVPSHKILSLEWENIKGMKELDTLASSKHFPLALVYLGFKKDDISHPLDGFGFLVPEAERLNILGTLFSSTLFPGRAPEGQVLLTTFVGGERNPELARLPVKNLVTLVQEELSKVLGIKGEPSFQEVKLWPQAIPLPDLEMGNRKKAAKKLSKLNPGLSFSGSYLSGASLPNCLEAS